MKTKTIILIALLFYSCLASADLLYETEKIRDRIRVNPSYSKSDPHKKADDYLEYINKTNPSYTLSFYDDSSSICPNWFKGIKKSNESSSEFCWRPSKPLIEMKSKWAYGTGSSFILMPDRLSRINFGEADFYSQPAISEACANSNKITANQMRNEINFTNGDSNLCAQQTTDNYERETALCRLPIEKKYNQFSYVPYGGYVGTQISVIVNGKALDKSSLAFDQKFGKYLSKYSLDNSDSVFLANGVLRRTTIFGKDKSGRGYIEKEGFNKPVSVLCVLGKDRVVKAIETIDN
jgi:hypothetical protein